MKKIYVLIIVIVVSAITEGLGQYTSIFGLESTEWNYLSLWCDSGPTSTLTDSRDTIVDNIEYKIIARAEDFETSADFGLMRESADRSKVWFRHFDESEEILIMDLDLTLSDSLTFIDDKYAVDTIYFDDNNRKVIELDLFIESCAQDFTFSYTEGVGPNFGFDFMVSPDIQFFFQSIIRCHTKDDMTENYNSYTDECPPFTTISTTDINVGRLDINPNPTSGELNIQLPDAISGQLSVRDVTGQVVMTVNLAHEEKLSIDLFGYNSGMYLMEVVSDEGERYVERVVLY